MSVIKVRIQKDFTVLYNGVLENPRLSFKAKGLWAYCMSRPDNWQFHVTHLATVSKEGIDAIYSALKELKEAGLVEFCQPNKGKGLNNGRGCFEKAEYIIYPYPQELKIVLPLRENPDAESPDLENPALTSTDNIPRTDCKKRPPPPSSKKDPLDKLREHFEEEEVSFIKKRLEERPKHLPPIKCLMSWAKTLLANRDDIPDYMEILTKKHKNKAIEWEKSGEKHRGDRVFANKDHVEFSCGPHCVRVDYAVSDEEWEEKTGWKTNEK